MTEQPSPVEAPASPVGQGWRYLTPKQKGILLASAAGIAVVAMMAWSAHRNAQQQRPAAPPPVRQSSASEPFTPPPVPRVQQVVAPAAIVQPAVGPHSFGTSEDPRKKARESEIMGLANQAGQPPANAAHPAAAEDMPARQSELADRLTATEFAGVRAKELPDPHFLIAQGRQIPCTQQTAIDTSYPGFVRATIPVDIRSETGDVVLLDRGSRLVGTMEKAMTNGLERQFVLWTRIITPPIYDRAGKAHQYSVAVNSPAADEVGATGLPGDVDRHVWRKIGGAIMLSLLEGGIQAGTAALQPSGSSNISIGGGGLGQLPTQLLQSTINIPDVLHRNQGSACTVFVARDLDLSNIYSLRRR